jgi:PhnB protein
MASQVKPIPDGAQAVTPYICIAGASDAIDFYKRAFNAQEIMRVNGPGNSVGHAEIEIGGSRIMLADEFPEMGFRGPKSWGGSPVHLHLYVLDADNFARNAVAAGGKLIRPVADQFYGDRSGTVEDPFGHVWHIATHKEDLTPEEIQARAASEKPRPDQT